MGYIDKDYDDINRALLFILAIVVLEFVKRCEHMATEKIRIGRSKIAHGMQGLIYSKVFKVTSSSNKKFGKGELNGLVNRDPFAISHFIHQCSVALTMPFAIISALFNLYLIIGYIVVYALAAILLNAIAMYGYLKVRSRMFQALRKHFDERGNALIEMVENIKVIKINSYTQKFLDSMIYLKAQE